MTCVTTGIADTKCQATTLSVWLYRSIVFWLYRVESCIKRRFFFHCCDNQQLCMSTMMRSSVYFSTPSHRFSPWDVSNYCVLDSQYGGRWEKPDNKCKGVYSREIAFEWSWLLMVSWVLGQLIFCNCFTVLHWKKCVSC